jgi:polyhydroxybutyrate depolymerase
MRSYVAYVPRSYSGLADVPLVVNAHAFMEDPSQQAMLSRMNAKAEQKGFIVVYPRGTGPVRTLLSFNAGLCCGRAAENGVDDVGFVRAVVNDASARVRVDRKRVYATGMSNGGFLAHRLACEASDIIAAIAPVAGVNGVPSNCAPKRPVPLMHFHGTDDRVVPYNGGGKFPSVQKTVNDWAARNGCTGTAAQSFNVGNSRCVTRSRCSGGAEVTLCTITGGGHEWPGGGRSVATLNATDHMWNFFSKFSL